MIRIWASILTALLCLNAFPVAAHPGGTDNSGCHKNSSTQEKHCHIADLKVVRPSERSACPVDQSRSCKGCGCKGGPGYRHIKSGTCVSYENEERLCGTSNDGLCKFEEHPLADANRACMTIHPDEIVEGEAKSKT